MKTHATLLLQHRRHNDGHETLRLVDGIRMVARINFEMDCTDFGLLQGGSCFIHYLQTREPFRGRGHATRLLREVELRTLSSGRAGVALLCDVNNIRLQHFYIARGFRTSRPQPPRIFTGGTFLLMEKLLDDVRIAL